METHNKHKLHFNYSSATLHLLRLLSVITISLQTLTCTSRAAESPPLKELLVGFEATPNPSTSTFQPLLTDSTGNYSLGFLRVDRDQLNLCVLHAPSLVPVWSVGTTRLPRWADRTHLSFNGSLVLSDPRKGIFWSSNTLGGRVWLSNTSNLMIQDGHGVVLWESFKFPSDTLMENQNFTSSMTLVSSNGLYSMRLGPDYFGLYARFSSSDPGPGQMYLKHGALEAKADIIEGQPIHMILMSDGYLGMYQNGSAPADVLPFNTFQRNVTGTRRVRLEPDGNLKVYYWTGSSWILDYQAISDSDKCELPSSCGSYGLCKSGKDCSCLGNRTVDDDTGRCTQPGSQNPTDFCGTYDNNRFKVLRKSGVDLPFKDLMGYERFASIDQCEGACATNCTCWGVVYTNSSGFCYMLDYPVQTLLAVGDETKVGYFKVHEGVGKKRVGTWLGLGLGLLFGALLVFGGMLGLRWYKTRRRGVKGYEDEEGVGGVGPYKDLGAASFRSIELCEK